MDAPSSLRPAPPAPLRVFESTEDHVFGWAEPLLFYTWRGITRPETLVRAEGYFDLAASARPDGRFALLGAVEMTASAPNSELRQRLAAVMRRHADRTVGSAFIVDSQGFKAAAMRSVAIGIGFIVREPFAHRVFSSVDSAAEWVGGLLTAQGVEHRGAAEIAATFGRLRRTPGR